MNEFSAAVAYEERLCGEGGIRTRVVGPTKWTDLPWIVRSSGETSESLPSQFRLAPYLSGPYHQGRGNHTATGREPETGRRRASGGILP